MTPRAVRGTQSRPWAAITGGALLCATLGYILLVPALPLFDPYAQDLGNALAPPFSDMRHPFGTDALGRDILSRLALAGRTSILIAGSALVLNMAVGVTAGMIAGYFGGASEAVIMGLADLQLSIPVMMLLVMVVAVVGPSETTLAIVLGLTYWVGYGRVARVMAMSLREREYVLAALTHGASSAWIMRRHLLPAILPQLAILGSFDLGVLVIMESGLSFLGLGVQPPTPSWGGMISEGQNYLQLSPWLCVFPGLAICFLVGGVQILSQRFTGEGRRIATHLAAGGA